MDTKKLQPQELKQNHSNSLNPTSKYPIGMDTGGITKQADTIRERANRHRLHAHRILWGLVLPSIVGAIIWFTAAGYLTTLETAYIQDLRDKIYDDGGPGGGEGSGGGEGEGGGERSGGGEGEGGGEGSGGGEGEGGGERSGSATDVSDFFAPLDIQININRFGTVALILFAVVLFMGLYRLNMRLAVFYEARADSLYLLLAGDISTHLQAISDSMTPSVEMGKLPSTLIDKSIELAKILKERKTG